MKTKNGLHLFPGFLMSTANRKLSENFKLIDPLLGGGAPKEENYILYNGVKYSGFVPDLAGDGAAFNGVTLTFDSPITTSGAKNGFIIVSTVLKTSEEIFYNFPILQYSDVKGIDQTTIELSQELAFNYLNAGAELLVYAINLYVLP